MSVAVDVGGTKYQQYSLQATASSVAYWIIVDVLSRKS